MTDVARKLHARLSADLRPAMKARDAVRVRTIRSLMSAIDNAGAVTVADPRGPEDPAIGLGTAEAPRAILDAAALTAILDAEERERLDAARQRAELGRPDDAATFEAEAAVVRTYLADLVP